jgi:hypothetical protein
LLVKECHNQPNMDSITPFVQSLLYFVNGL